ncbi:MAG: hypothetical protein HRU40_13595 [Saprospiraceae bacterium]|nr:hypothetical protein [Saprospiraceae bacterium]
MACGPLTTGFDFECDDSSGGIQAGSILITQYENIDKSTSVIASGVITTLSQVAATDFYRYSIKKEIANNITTVTKDPVLGSTFYESVFQMALHKLSAAKNVELELLASKPIVIIYQDLNDVYHLIGYDNGAEAFFGGTSDSQTGTAFADMNGYNIGVNAKEKHFPYTVDPTVIAGLSIG